MVRIAEVTDLWGWKGKLLLGDRVVEELCFWRDNLVSLNGHRMRKEDRVIKLLTADMYSDAGVHMIGGAQFVGEQVLSDTVYNEYFDEH